MFNYSQNSKHLQLLLPLLLLLFIIIITLDPRYKVISELYPNPRYNEMNITFSIYILIFVMGSKAHPAL